MKKIFVSAKHDSEHFEKEIKYLEAYGYKSVQILSTIGTNFGLEIYNPILLKTQLKIIGGIFPEASRISVRNLSEGNGETANNGNIYAEILNKTAVVCNLNG
jgi:hypothetical protein